MNYGNWALRINAAPDIYNFIIDHDEFDNPDCAPQFVVCCSLHLTRCELEHLYHDICHDDKELFMKHLSYFRKYLSDSSSWLVEKRIHCFLADEVPVRLFDEYGPKYQYQRFAFRLAYMGTEKVSLE